MAKGDEEEERERRLLNMRSSCAVLTGHASSDKLL